MRLAMVVVGFALAACEPPHLDLTANQVRASGVRYPVGPYGYAPGEVIENLRFIGKYDSTAPYAGLPLRTFAFADYYGDPSVRYLLLLENFGWCAPSERLQPAMKQAQLGGQANGIRLLDLYAENASRQAANEHDLDVWQAKWDLHVPLALDPENALCAYDRTIAAPVAVLVRIADMRIAAVAVGETDCGALISSLATR